MIVFAATIVSGAFLLFLVQPMIGKFILPWFGGSPGVWTVCMLFFQTLLLAGYAYAHATSRWLSPRVQAAVHLCLLALAVAALPITPDDAWQPAAGDDPTLRILLLLSGTIGLAYFALATTSPLLQRWYSGLRGEAPPYRLFALSNAASLLALLAYPFAIEPILSRDAQTRLWSWGMLGFGLLCAACAIRVLRESPAAAPASEAAAPDVSAPGRREFALWLALPTLACVMLLATTHRLCEEVAAIPFLWVLPLAVYLLSFVLCFESPRWYHRGVFAVALLMGLAEYREISAELLPLALAIPGYALLLFVVCMVCHGELYRLRPHPRHLTAFYLTTAAGGALGGVAVALVAPVAFAHHEEFELALLACPALALVVHYLDRGSPLHGGRPRLAWALLLAALLGLAGALGARELRERERFVAATRDFYGSLYVLPVDTPGGERAALALWHGNTNHGLQVLEGPLSRSPIGYYDPRSGIGRALASLRLRGPLHIGVVGLGTGTLAAWGRPGDRMRFYELDPRVERIAREHFSYLSHSRARSEVVLGDARLSLAGEPAQGFDLLALDAFSSDAIPVHLLTHEAFEIYLRHLRADGIVAVHVTNRHLALGRVLLDTARHFGLSGVRVAHEAEAGRWWIYPTTWVLLARDPALLAAPEIGDAAQPLDDVDPVRWTDDTISLFRVLR